MSQPKVEAEARLAALELRMSQVEQRLTGAIDQFFPIGPRVTELSGAFQAANVRLRGLETRLEAIEAEPPPPDVSEVLTRLAAIEERISRVETAGNRRGRLSSRLAEIEAKLEEVQGGGEDGEEPGVPAV